MLVICTKEGEQHLSLKILIVWNDKPEDIVENIHTNIAIAISSNSRLKEFVAMNLIRIAIPEGKIAIAELSDWEQVKQALAEPGYAVIWLKAEYDDEQYDYPQVRQMVHDLTDDEMFLGIDALIFFDELSPDSRNAYGEKISGYKMIADDLIRGIQKRDGQVEQAKQRLFMVHTTPDPKRFQEMEEKQFLDGAYYPQLAQNVAGTLVRKISSTYNRKFQGIPLILNQALDNPFADEFYHQYFREEWSLAKRQLEQALKEIKTFPGALDRFNIIGIVLQELIKNLEKGITLSGMGEGFQEASKRPNLSKPRSELLLYLGVEDEDQNLHDDHSLRRIFRKALKEGAPDVTVNLTTLPQGVKPEVFVPRGLISNMFSEWPFIGARAFRKFGFESLELHVEEVYLQEVEIYNLLFIIRWQGKEDLSSLMNKNAFNHFIEKPWTDFIYDLYLVEFEGQVHQARDKQWHSKPLWAEDFDAAVKDAATSEYPKALVFIFEKMFKQAGQS